MVDWMEAEQGQWDFRCGSLPGGKILECIQAILQFFASHEQLRVILYFLTKRLSPAQAS